MAEIAELVDKILERTEEGKIPWTATAEEGAYVASMPNQSLVVYRARPPMAATWTTATVWEDATILSIVNKDGLEVERVDSGSCGEQTRDKLRGIYETARRLALRTDAELDNLLEYLQKGLS